MLPCSFHSTAFTESGPCQRSGPGAAAGATRAPSGCFPGGPGRGSRVPGHRCGGAAATPGGGGREDGLGTVGDPRDRGLAAALGFCSLGSWYDPVLRQTELFVPAALAAPEQSIALKERGAEALRTLLLAFKEWGCLGPPLPRLFGGLWSGLATSPRPRILAEVCVLFPRGFQEGDRS